MEKRTDFYDVIDRIQRQDRYIEYIEEENKKLKEENEYRKSIADVLPEGEGHIAEETIQDLQKEIKNLKLIQETNEKQIQNDNKERDELREENKKLKEDLRIAQGLVEKYEEIELKMGEEIRELKDELLMYMRK